MINEKMFLRKAKMEDVDLLFQWVNDESVRINAFDTHLITYDEHISWFTRMMENPDQIQYILMLDDEPVGQIRLSIEDGEAIIDYSIVSSKRGNGYGSYLISLVTERIKVDRPDVKKLIGKVKSSNTASMKCFVSNSFEETFRQFEFSLK